MVDYLVIGSSGMVTLYPQSRASGIADIDMICTFDYFKKLVKSGNYRSSFIADAHAVMKPKDDPDAKIIDIDLALDNNSSMDILKYWYNCDQTSRDYEQILATIKLSHRYKDSPSFEKTYYDLKTFVGDLKYVNRYIANLPKELRDILVKREKETYENQSKISLMKSKDEFFANDGVEYIHDHDMLHELVSILSVPAYKSFLMDGHDVYCDHAKFMQLDHTRKCHAVMEEAAVIALERGVFPFNKQSTIDSYEMSKLLCTALRKICTSLTSGWFREFAYENYPDLVFLLIDDKFTENLLVKIRKM